MLAVVTAYSIYDISHVAGTLTMGPADARDLAARLVACAEKAEAMAAERTKVSP